MLSLQSQMVFPEYDCVQDKADALRMDWIIFVIP